MWAPIIANFFHIIFVIFGFYGAYHFRAKYIVAVSIIFIGYVDERVVILRPNLMHLGRHFSRKAA